MSLQVFSSSAGGSWVGTGGRWSNGDDSGFRGTSKQLLGDVPHSLRTAPALRGFVSPAPVVPRRDRCCAGGPFEERCLGHPSREGHVSAELRVPQLGKDTRPLMTADPPHCF